MLELFFKQKNRPEKKSERLSFQTKGINWCKRFFAFEFYLRLYM